MKSICTILVAVSLLTGCTPEPVEVIGPTTPTVQRGKLGCWYKNINGEWMPQGLPLCQVTLDTRAEREQTRWELLGG